MADENILTDAELSEYAVKEVEQQNTINYNGKTIQELMGLVSLHEKIRLSHNVIQSDTSDLYFFEDEVKHSASVQELLIEGEKILPTFKYLVQDLFLALFLQEAYINPILNTHKSVSINRVIMNQILNTPDFLALRKSCIGIPLLSTVAAGILGDDALEIYRNMINSIDDLDQKKEHLDELLEEEEQIDDIVDIIENLGNQINNQLRSPNPDTDALQALENDINENTMTLEEAKNKIEQAAQQCEELISDSTVNNIPETVSEFVTQSLPEVSETQDIIHAFGIVDSHGQLRIPFQSAVYCTELIRHTDKLRKMLKDIGRTKDIASIEQKKKSKHGAVEIASVTTGDNICDTLPSERMNLVMDTTKKDFYRRYGDKNLLTFQKTSNKDKNKGPIIVCVDTSGSMRGDKERWSKAFTAGVIEIAQMQKRDFACILYDNNVEDPIIISKNEVAPEKMIKCMETFLDGGTNFERPLEKAIDLIKKSQFKEADILFITDGHSTISDRFLKHYQAIKEEKEFQTKGVLVNVGGYYGCSDEALKEFCDDIVTVSSMADLDADSTVNKQIFGAL